MNKVNYAIIYLRATIIALVAGVLGSVSAQGVGQNEVDTALSSFENAACSISDSIRGPIGAAIVVVAIVVTGASIMLGQQGGAKKIVFALIGLLILGLIPTVLAIAGLTSTCP